MEIMMMASKNNFRFVIHYLQNVIKWYSIWIICVKTNESKRKVWSSIVFEWLSRFQFVPQAEKNISVSVTKFQIRRQQYKLRFELYLLESLCTVFFIGNIQLFLSYLQNKLKKAVFITVWNITLHFRKSVLIKTILSLNNTNFINYYQPTCKKQFITHCFYV